MESKNQRHNEWWSCFTIIFKNNSKVSQLSSRESCQVSWKQEPHQNHCTETCIQTYSITGGGVWGGNKDTLSQKSIISVLSSRPLFPLLSVCWWQTTWIYRNGRNERFEYSCTWTQHNTRWRRFMQGCGEQWESDPLISYIIPSHENSDLILYNEYMVLI